MSSASEDWGDWGNSDDDSDDVYDENEENEDEEEVIRTLNDGVYDEDEEDDDKDEEIETLKTRLSFLTLQVSLLITKVKHLEDATTSQDPYDYDENANDDGSTSHNPYDDDEDDDVQLEWHYHDGKMFGSDDGHVVYVYDEATKADCTAEYC